MENVCGIKAVQFQERVVRLPLQGLVGHQFLMHGPMLYLIMFYSKRTSLVSTGLRVRREGGEKKK